MKFNWLIRMLFVGVYILIVVIIINLSLFFPIHVNGWSHLRDISPLFLLKLMVQLILFVLIFPIFFLVWKSIFRGKIVVIHFELLFILVLSLLIFTLSMLVFALSLISFTCKFKLSLTIINIWSFYNFKLNFILVDLADLFIAFIEQWILDLWMLLSLIKNALITIFTLQILPLFRMLVVIYIFNLISLLFLHILDALVMFLNRLELANSIILLNIGVKYKDKANKIC
jgi:hypothetical protein